MSYVLDSGNENSKVIHITSTDATSSLSSEGSFLKYDLETPILTPSNQDTLISLYSAIVPYSFYNIRKDINDRVYYYTSKASANPNNYKYFVIPEGSYTINSLKSSLINSLNDATTNHLTNGNTTITFDRTTMKFVFIQTTVEWFFTTVGHPDTVLNVAHISLGLPENYDFNSNSFIQNAVTNKFDFTSINVPDVNGGVHSVNIRTNLSSKGCIDSQSKSFSTILGTIPIDVNFGGIVFFRPADAIHKIITSGKDIKNITIRITDDRDRLLNLNGLSFNVTILIDHIRHGRNTERRREIIDRPLVEKPTRGRPPKKDNKTKKDIPIPLIN